MKVERPDGSWFGGTVWFVAPANGSMVSIHFHSEGYEQWAGGKQTPNKAPWAFVFDAADVVGEDFRPSIFRLLLRNGTKIICGKEV
ncbi:MAG TPA: hypothetical protein VFT87_05710 [Candidatus Saccharimonadales bacterium]|nr:hypothetical protein [Candidatus Saccharimonadales bacterium]